MESGKQIRQKATGDSTVGLRRIDNLIFFICLLIAAIFWGSIKLSEEYSESFIYNLRYTQIPDEKKMTSLDDSTVTVSVSARGFTILRMWLFEDMSNIEINLEDLTIDRREGNHYFIYTQELKEAFANRLELDESLFDFSKTTLGFVLEELDSKQIFVVEKLNLKFKREYDLYEAAVVTPDEITVFGPKDMLDTLTFLYTENIQLSEVDSDLSVNARVANPNPGLLRLSPEEVTVTIRVEKYTESSIEIPVDFSGMKQQVKSFPNTVKVNFKVARKDFNLIQPGQFQVIPETEGVDIQKTDRLHLKLARQPEIIRNPWIVPADVEFLIIK